MPASHGCPVVMDNLLFTIKSVSDVYNHSSCSWSIMPCSCTPSPQELTVLHPRYTPEPLCGPGLVFPGLSPSPPDCPIHEGAALHCCPHYEGKQYFALYSRYLALYRRYLALYRRSELGTRSLFPGSLSAHFISMDRYRSSAHFANFQVRSLLNRSRKNQWFALGKRKIAPKTTAVRSYVCIGTYICTQSE